MTPRQRILATLERQAVDRPPVDVWLTPEVLASLKAHVGEPDELTLVLSTRGRGARVGGNP